MNERLNSMNEFREALKEQTGRMATRIELTKVDEAVQRLEQAKANLDGRMVVIGGMASAAISIILWGLARALKF